MPAINENLKSLRRAKGMTQAEVADAISVARQTVSSYESGRTQPDLETLKRLANVYQTDIHDVLYGGSRFQKRLKRVKWAILLLVIIMLMGILIRSFLFWTANKYFVMTSGTIVSSDNGSLINMRFALLRTAETIFDMCTVVFGIGCIIMLYPSVMVAQAITVRKILLFLGVVIVAILACAIPFALSDKTYAPIDYLWSIWNNLIPLFLLFLVALTAKYVKRRRF